MRGKLSNGNDSEALLLRELLNGLCSIFKHRVTLLHLLPNNEAIELVPEIT